jgi:hypothetical protein
VSAKVKQAAGGTPPYNSYLRTAMKFVEKMQRLLLRTRGALNKHPPATKHATLGYINKQFYDIASNIEKAVEDDASGRNGPPQGRLEFTLKEKGDAVLETGWSDPGFISEDDIQTLPGFRDLEKRANELGLNTILQKDENEAYDDEDRYYYTLVISGWESSL